MKSTRSFPIISADSHLEIDSKVWLPRVPEKWRDRAPRVIRRPDGRDAWLVENAPLQTPGGAVLSMRGDYAKTGPEALRYDGTPGTGPASQRIREQDQDGIEAEIFQWSVAGPHTFRNIQDDDPYKSCIRAYNAWLGLDYCAEDPTRLIGVGMIPLTGVDDAISEMEFCLKNGVRAIGLSSYPTGTVGVPTAADDKFWAAAQDLNAPVIVHVNMDHSAPRTNKFQYPPIPKNDKGYVFRGRGIVEECTNGKFCVAGGVDVVHMIFSGIFDRFPKLKIFMVENQIGWLPHYFEMVDARYERHVEWCEEFINFGRLKQKPTDYMREHIYWGFQENVTGVRQREIMGTNRLIWGSDFPHQESGWPNSMEVIDRNFAGCTDEETFMMTTKNAVDFYHLEDLLPKWEAAHEEKLSAKH